MAKFVTIGYGDEAGYERTSRAVRDAAHAHDAQLKEAGTEMGIAGSPVQVRNHDAGGTSTIGGPFMTSERTIRRPRPQRADREHSVTLSERSLP